jgi:uncharacterized delta-60 repeat protein
MRSGHGPDDGQGREFTEFVRHALHVAADQVDPSPDGLQQIRDKIRSRPAHARAGRFRLTVGLAAAVSMLADLLWRWNAALARGWHALRHGHTAPGTHRAKPDRPRQAQRPRDWREAILRPAFAVGFAVFAVGIVLAAVPPMRDAIVQQVERGFSSRSSTPGSTSPGGGQAQGNATLPGGAASGGRTVTSSSSRSPSSTSEATSPKSGSVKSTPAGHATNLDPTFGHGGIVATSLGVDANGNQIQASPGAVALQSNGDIVVAVGSGGPDSGLVRFLPNGTRDTTFGNGGFAALPDLGIPSVRPGLAVQSDGKLVWAGETTAANGTGAAFAVVRFNVNGTLDQGFGSGGLATAAFANSTVQGAQTVLVQPDGKILAGGAVLFGGRPPVDIGGLVRFNADGSIDQGFGSGGQELVPNSNPVLSSVIGVTALGLDASGDIFTLPSHLEFGPAGQPDAALTPAAITTASPSTSGAVAFLPSGGFVAGTEVVTGRNGDPDVQVTRFNPDGSTASVGTGIDYAGQNGALAVSDVPAAVAIQAKGQAVIGGTHTESGQVSSTSVFGLARVNAVGTLDPAFGTGGVLTTRIQGNDSVILLVIQPDGKILAVGTSHNAAGVQELALARYLSQ